MRYFIISDIHGSAFYLAKALEQFKSGSYDYLVILGDILYHGPRNTIPEGYNPSEVVALLNPMANQIIACRGNCEAEVDQMLLSFPCLSDYSLIVDGKVSFFATHGHLYTSEHFPKSPGKSIFLSGHTHLWLLEKQGDIIACNPGSITFPKEGRPHTYATYEDGILSIKDLEGKVLSSLEV
ncbi:MAG: phosphodiesterase [Cellulosilyticum sp.]|nr:phosphodiesterase [Cellulosilyticum sp.]MEE1072911.1 phosphodiesterase [Cellulosilyticum sp.]